MAEARVWTFTVEQGDEGERLDALLAKRSALSRSRVQRLVDAGHVLVDGRLSQRKSQRLCTGEVVRLEVPPGQPVELLAQDIPLSIVWEDEALLVVDKEAGMVVHPAPGHRDGTLVNALLHHVGDLAEVGGRLRPGIVHRLDKDTSGLLVVAKSDLAHRKLAGALSKRQVRRRYVTACWGHLTGSRKTIDAPVGRDPHDRKRMAVREDGRSAVTHLRVRERWRAADFLDVALQTGRTHQIRVHLAHVGHPVVGDAVYGAGRHRGMSGQDRPWAAELARRSPRQFLHAAELAFEHPLSGDPLRFRSALPRDLSEVVVWAREGATTGAPARPDQELANRRLLERGRPQE